MHNEEHNIYITGGQVKGESLIGYERHIDFISRFLKDQENNLSVTGLPRVGKTSLVKAALERVRNEYDGKLLEIFINLHKSKSFFDFLYRFLLAIKRELKLNHDNETIDNKDYNDCLKELDLAGKQVDFEEGLQELIRFLVVESGYKVIMVIDEFDHARDIFSEENFEYIRDLGNNAEMKISLVVISRRQLYFIEKKNVNNSTFDGIFLKKAISGFNEEDQKKFFEKLKEKYKVVVDDSFKNNVRHYCGNLPYFYSLIAHAIVEGVSPEKVDNIVAEAYKSVKGEIHDYYNAIIGAWSNDMIDAEGAKTEACTWNKIRAAVIGPQYELNRGDVDELIRQGCLIDDGEEYYAISKDFTIFLYQQPLCLEKTWESIMEVERRLKGIMRKEISVCKEKSGSVIDEEFWKKYINDDNAYKQCKKFINRTQKDYGKSPDYLDVCSLNTAVNIIVRNWQETFGAYFSKDVKDWERRLALCARARNPVAHGHEEYLSSIEKEEVILACKKIIEQLNRKDSNGASSNR